MANLAIYSERAFPLANPEGQAQTEAEINELEANLAQQEAKLREAMQRPALVRERIAQLNDQPNYAERKRALLEEAAMGDPPMDEFAAVFERLQVEQNFRARVLQHLGVFCQPAAEREILTARLAVAEARFHLLDRRTLLSMIQRHRLIGPLLHHERALEVTGGLTEALAERALQARKELSALEQAIREFDERVGAMQTRYTLL